MDSRGFFFKAIFLTVFLLSSEVYSQGGVFLRESNGSEINESDSTEQQAIVRTIQNQLEAIRSRNVLRAYKYTSKEFQDTTTLEEFQEFVTHYPVLGQNQRLIRQDVDTKEIVLKVGTFLGSLESTEGENLRVEYNLVEEGGEWRIIGIKLFQPPGYLQGNRN